MNRYLIALGGLAIALLITASIAVSHSRKQYDKREAQAEIHAGKADAYEEQARQIAEAKADASKRVTDADAKVAELRKEVARLRKAPASPDPAPDTPSPDPQPVGPVVDLAPVVARLDELVAAQDIAIRERDRKILLLQSEAYTWHKAHDERQAESIQLRAALEAQKGLAAGQLWKGRIQGFAVGVASGYVAGRLR